MAPIMGISWKLSDMTKARANLAGAAPQPEESAEKRYS
jgi:hypothetical protein